MTADKPKQRRTGLRIPGITAMARACGVSHSHMRYVRLGVRTPSQALKARMEAYMAEEKGKKKGG